MTFTWMIFFCLVFLCSFHAVCVLMKSVSFAFASRKQIKASAKGENVNSAKHNTLCPDKLNDMY